MKVLDFLNDWKKVVDDKKLENTSGFSVVAYLDDKGNVVNYSFIRRIIGEYSNVDDSNNPNRWHSEDVVLERNDFSGKPIARKLVSDFMSESDFGNLFYGTNDGEKLIGNLVSFEKGSSPVPLNEATFNVLFTGTLLKDNGATQLLAIGQSSWNMSEFRSRVFTETVYNPALKELPPVHLNAFSEDPAKMKLMYAASAEKIKEAAGHYGNDNSASSNTERLSLNNDFQGKSGQHIDGKSVAPESVKEKSKKCKCIIM